jgi:2',3'-cyclic-nucleotide 2'-phosphodiesterase (5'-nucleotidase family)
LDQNVPEEPNTAAAVDALIAGIEATYGPLFTQQVGFASAFFKETADSLLFKGPRDTPAGNLVADAFRNKTGTEIAIEVGGSTAQPLHEGPLVAADLFRVCGYGFNEVNGLGFRIAKFKMTGAALWQAMETVLASIEVTDDYLPQVSGMRYQYDATMPPGSRVVYVEINGSVLDPDREYSMSGNEFLLYVVENVFGIPVSDAYVFEDSTEFEVLLDYVLSQPNQTVSPYTDGRVYSTTTVVGTKETDALANTLQLDQNYPNPVTTGTRIRWHQPEGGFTTLSVYDLTGKEVATPVRGYLSSGTHDVYWTPGDLNSGLYYYTLYSGAQQTSRKLLITR